jgi:hypothetical protein
MIMYEELARTGKEATVTCFKTLFRCSPGATEENQENIRIVSARYRLELATCRVQARRVPLEAYLFDNLFKIT